MPEEDFDILEDDPQPPIESSAVDREPFTWVHPNVWILRVFGAFGTLFFGALCTILIVGGWKEIQAGHPMGWVGVGVGAAAAPGLLLWFLHYLLHPACVVTIDWRGRRLKFQKCWVSGGFVLPLVRTVALSFNAVQDLKVVASQSSFRAKLVILGSRKKVVIAGEGSELLLLSLQLAEACNRFPRVSTQDTGSF
jgi:hypothetical protein